MQRAVRTAGRRRARAGLVRWREGASKPWAAARSSGVLNWVVGALTLAIGGLVAAFVPGTERALGVMVMVAAFVPVLSGKYYVDAGRSLQSVVTAPGDGVPEVMQGLRLIRNALRMEAAMIVLGAVVALVLGAMGFSGHR